MMSSVTGDAKMDGLRFETYIKRRLKDSGLELLNLGYNEIGDFLLLGEKIRIIECKVSHKDNYYFSKNQKQKDRLFKLRELYDISLYYIVQFPHRKVIKVFYIDDGFNDIKLNYESGYDLKDAIKFWYEKIYQAPLNPNGEEVEK